MPTHSPQPKKRRTNSGVRKQTPTGKTTKTTSSTKVFHPRNYTAVEHKPLTSEKGALKWWECEPYKGEQKVV